VSAETSDRVLERLSRLHPKLIDLSLGRIERLLAALGNPHERLPPVIHVAGTNGKGSTNSDLARLPSSRRKPRAHLHLTASRALPRTHPLGRTADRGGSADRVARRMRARHGGTPITYFEITTAAALLAFARTPADIVVLETASADGSTQPT